MDYRYILFDLDGTLTDPFEGITGSVAYALEKMGFPVPDRKELTPYIGPPLLYGFQHFAGMTESQAEEAIVQYRVRFSKTGIFENAVIAGAEELLKNLKDQGKTILLATSKPEVYAKQILEHFDLAKYFDHICGATMDSSRSKKADVIAYALEKGGVTDPRTACMIGDRHHDIEGGRQCGLHTIGVLCGYGSREELQEAGADVILDDLKALKAHFAPMMQPESIVTFYPCRSIPETIAYYNGVLGFPVYKDLGNSVWFDCGSGYLAFCDYGPDRPMATGICLSFNLKTTAAVDEMYQVLKNKPVIGLKGAPQQHPKFPVYSFFFSDPNGYTLEYQRTTDDL